jgi:hypothetical protein
MHTLNMALPLNNDHIRGMHHPTPLLFNGKVILGVCITPPLRYLMVRPYYGYASPPPLRNMALPLNNGGVG